MLPVTRDYFFSFLSIVKLSKLPLVVSIVMIDSWRVLDIEVLMLFCTENE